MKVNDLIKLAPLENYQAPDLPQLVEAQPDLLKKVPSRWKAKAVIAVATGILGTTALTGCGSQIPSFTPIEYTGNPIPAPNVRASRIYCSDLHFGGSGGAPIYVAHLTEQEALNIIGQQFFQAGIFLEVAMPRPRINASDIYYELGNFGWAHTEGTMFPNYVEMQFIDEGSGVGIVLIKNWSWWLGSSCTTDIQASIERRFQREHGISVRVIFETGRGLGWWSEDWGLEEFDSWWDEETQTRLIPDDVRDPLLEQANENLAEQTQQLIDQLREDGIID